MLYFSDLAISLTAIHTYKRKKDFYIQCFCNFFYVAESDILFSTFYHTNICSV